MPFCFILPSAWTTISGLSCWLCDLTLSTWGWRTSCCQYLLQSCPWVVFVLFCFVFYLFIYFWLYWVFVSAPGLSLVVASRDHSSSRCAGLSLSRPLLWWSTGSRRASSVVVAYRPSCSVACGIFPDQGSNLCPLHWRQILNHCATREAPRVFSFTVALLVFMWGFREIEKLCYLHYYLPGIPVVQ